MKVRKARTDPEPLPSEVDGLEGRPEAENLVSIYAALADKTAADVLRDFGDSQFSEFKKALSEVAVETLVPLTDEMNRLLKDPAEIDAVLCKGAQRARALADPILESVHETVGFVR